MFDDNVVTCVGVMAYRWLTKEIGVTPIPPTSFYSAANVADGQDLGEGILLMHSVPEYMLNIIRNVCGCILIIICVVVMI